MRLFARPLPQPLSLAMYIEKSLHKQRPDLFRLGCPQGAVSSRSSTYRRYLPCVSTSMKCCGMRTVAYERLFASVTCSAYDICLIMILPTVWGRVAHLKLVKSSKHEAA